VNRGRWVFDYLLGAYGTLGEGPQRLTYLRGLRGDYYQVIKYEFRHLSARLALEEIRSQARLGLPGIRCHIALTDDTVFDLFHWCLEEFREPYRRHWTASDPLPIVQRQGKTWEYKSANLFAWPIPFAPAQIVRGAWSCRLPAESRKVIDATMRARRNAVKPRRTRMRLPRQKSALKLGSWAWARVQLPDGDQEIREVPLDLLFELSVSDRVVNARILPS